jgi:hypothetical protein
MRILGFICVFVLILSCRNEKVDEPISTPENQIKVTVQPYFGSEKLYLDSIFSFSDGNQIKFTDIKFYFSEITNENSKTLIDAALFNYSFSGNSFFSKTGDYLDFKSIKGYLGVNNDNHKDPSAFPNSSPLNIMNSDGMHWGWNTGYSFVQIEARADTLNDGIKNFNHTIVFHVGTDQFLQNLNYSNLNWQSIGNYTYQLAFKLDMKDVFEISTQPINIKTEFMTHSSAGQEALSLKVIQNFKSALNPM